MSVTRCARPSRPSAAAIVSIAANNRHRTCAFFECCLIVLRMTPERDPSLLSLRPLPAGLLLLGPLLRPAR
jgi:hypothetical protein